MEYDGTIKMVENEWNKNWWKLIGAVKPAHLESQGERLNLRVYGAFISMNLQGRGI